MPKEKGSFDKEKVYHFLNNLNPDSESTMVNDGGDEVSIEWPSGREWGSMETELKRMAAEKAAFLWEMLNNTSMLMGVYAKSGLYRRKGLTKEDPGFWSFFKDMVPAYAKNQSTAANIFILVYYRIISEAGRYEPPKDIYSIRQHLFCIWMFFDDFSQREDFTATFITPCIDLAAMKLIAQMRYLQSIFMEKIKDEDRIILSKRKSAEKQEIVRQQVIEECFKIPGWYEKKPHTLATMIRDTFKKKDNKAPAHETIKKYLRESGNKNLENIFIKR